MRSFLFVLLFFSLRISGQQNDCLPSAEITVTSDEIQLASTKYQIIKDSKKNYVIYYPEGEKNSFWYRITVESDCRFAFKLSSADSLISSKYFLYKSPEMGNFCKELKKKKIIPARSGDFFEEKSNPVTFFSSGKKKEVSFIQPVTATKGDIYYLNIRHEEESECGHYLYLIVSSEVVSFRATYPKCMEEEKNEKNFPMPVAALKAKEIKTMDSLSNPSIAEVKQIPEIETKKEAEPVEKIKEVEQRHVTEIAITSNQKTTGKRNITAVTVTGTVLDSLTNKPLLAELKWTDEITGKEIVAQTNSEGEYAIVLEEKVIYKLTSSVVGYKEKTTKFIRQNLNSDAMKQDFAMTSLKPGENFVLKHIYFYAGTYAMKPESQPELEKLFSYLVSHEKVKIEIQGHTNGEGKISKGSSSVKKKKGEGWDFHGNEKKLSKFRAEAIRNFLLKNGIPEDRVISEGMGASRMIYPEPKNQKEREANRRVEVYILSSATDLETVLNAISE